MNPNPQMNLEKPRPFWQRALIILGIDTLIVLSGALIFRESAQISNLYFLSSLVLFIIAAIPIATEIGGSARIAGRAIKDNKDVSTLLKEKQAIYKRNAQTTYAFGLAGIITFLLSFVTTLV